MIVGGFREYEFANGSCTVRASHDGTRFVWRLYVEGAPTSVTGSCKRDKTLWRQAMRALGVKDSNP